MNTIQSISRHIVRKISIAMLLLVATGVFANPVEAPQVVNINTADAQTLADVLVGVGLNKAELIISYRKAHGEFKDAYELANVNGIGEKLVANNESRIRLKD